MVGDNIDHTHRRQMYVAARPSRRNCFITISCGSVSGSGDTLWESVREWLLVPPFTRTFLKSPSSRCLSAIAELLVRQLRELMANICSMERDIDNRARALERTKSLLHCRKISWTWVHIWLKTGPEFLPTLAISFRPSPSHIYGALTGRCTATLNETALDLSAAQIWGPKRC